MQDMYVGLRDDLIQELNDMGYILARLTGMNAAYRFGTVFAEFPLKTMLRGLI